MLTILTALSAFGGCNAARWYLDRSSRRETAYWGGRVRLKALWNSGAAFSLPIPPEALRPASAAALAVLWTTRKRSPFGTGLILGGGLSNLYERVSYGKVYDYLQFPKAPGPLRRYVFNLADLSILSGCALCICGKKRASKR